MNIKEIAYGRTKNTGNYQSERVEIRVTVDEDDSYNECLASAKLLVAQALGEGPSASEVEAAKEVLARASAVERSTALMVRKVG